MNTTERYVLDQMVPELQASGFAVFVEPRRQMLPAFMGAYRPDAIAIGPSKNIAVEIKSDDSERSRKLDWIAGLFEGRKDWELRVYYARPAAQPAAVPRSSTAAIASTIAGVRNLIARGDSRAALLMGWAAFEAEGRRHLPEDARWPLSLDSLLEQLAFAGTVTPTEADVLRRLAGHRDRLIHGDLDIVIEDEDVVALVGIVQTLMSLEDEPLPDPTRPTQ